MEFVVDQLQLLKLNHREVKVFMALATFGRMTTTKIAGHAGLPRTTVDAIVRRLSTCGLISQVRIGKHWEWEVVMSEVTKKLSLLQEKFTLGQNDCDTNATSKTELPAHISKTEGLTWFDFVQEVTVRGMISGIITTEGTLLHALKDTDFTLTVRSTIHISKQLISESEQARQLLRNGKLNVQLLTDCLGLKGVDVLMVGELVAIQCGDKVTISKDICTTCLISSLFRSFYLLRKSSRSNHCLSLKKE